MMKAKIYITLIMLVYAVSAFGQLEKVAESNEAWNGVTVSSSGRIFVCFPHLEGSAGIRVGEVLPGNKIVPYPSKEWNDWQPGSDAAGKVVRPNALRIGPDGYLWIVDTGSPSLGADPLPGGAAKLIAVDIRTNRVVRTIPLQPVAKKHSFFDDLRIYKNTILMTDAGEPAIIVLDLKTGHGRRVLENHPLTIDKLPLYAEGEKIRTSDGKLLRINADQLEVSPDGKWFYFQQVSGPLAKIPLKDLTDEKLSPKELAKRPLRFFDSPTTGGTCIDSEGNIYMSDVNHLRIIKVTPAGKSTVLISDKRLIWCDAMWLDEKGYLYLPCAQINRLKAFHRGKNLVSGPVILYKIKTSSRPFKS